MIDPAILRAMQAAGASIDVIIAAVEADAAIENERLIDKRAKDAERQRRHRASRNVTVTERDNADSVTDPALSLSPNENNSNPHTHTHPEGVNAPTREASRFPRPEGVDPQHWTDFLANRKRKRLANTPTAHKRLIADLARFSDDEWPPGRLVEHAAARGWAAIFDPRPSRNPANDRKPASTDEITNPYAREVARRQAERAGVEYG